NQNASSPLEVSTDLAGMFNDTPQARRLMQFLASDEAQRIWPALPGGSAFTVDRNVPPSVSPDAVSARIAATLRSSDLVCVDASDTMPNDMRDAFRNAVLEYLNHPSDLDTLLKKLDEVRTGIAHNEWLNLRCS